MPIIKNLEYEGEEGKKITKKGKTTNNMKEKTSHKKSGGFLGFIIALILIVIIVGVIFAYTNGKLSKLQGSQQVTLELSQQVENLKDELNALSSKAKVLQEENKQNEEILVDLFDKNRSFPDNFDTKDWLVYNNEDLKFQIQIPEYWEVAKSVVNTKEVEKPVVTEDEQVDKKDEQTSENKAEVVVENKVQQSIYLQPKNETAFALSMTIKNDYLDLNALPLAEKVELFKSLPLIDQKDFTQGKMLYYIDIDDNKNNIPTILILTNTDIYKATFNVTDKTLNNYFKYRLDFEKIVLTFMMSQPAVAVPAVTE